MTSGDYLVSALLGAAFCASAFFLTGFSPL